MFTTQVLCVFGVYEGPGHSLGLTERLLSPSEDFTLPESYNIGLVRRLIRLLASPLDVCARRRLTLWIDPVQRWVEHANACTFIDPALIDSISKQNCRKTT